MDDYSRFTWVKFLASKDDAPDFIIKLLKMIKVRLNTPVGNIRTDNGTDFVNQTLRRYYESVGISHETLVARSPQKMVSLKGEIILLLKPLKQFPVVDAPRAVDLADSPVSTSIDQDAPSTTCKAKKDVPSKKNPSFKPKPTKKKASVKADRGKGVLDKKHRKTSGADEGSGTKPEVTNVPKYDYENDKESWGDSEEEEDDDDNDDDDNDGDDDDEDKDANNQEDDEEKTDKEEEKVDDEKDDEVTKELYKDMNMNLGNENANMTDADQAGTCQRNVSQESGFHQVDEDAHVTLTPVLDTQKIDEPLQSSSVSSYFTSKILNLENPSLADNKIASLMDTTVRLEELGSQTSSLYTIPITAVLEITSIFTITIPPPPHFFNPFPQQAPPNLTPTTSEATTCRC
nr:integrase, catalytic region, zinc finger, CCHC-type, peptidase aspartic, catalytic [Tanacetum cinerariifolium]